MTAKTATPLKLEENQSFKEKLHLIAEVKRLNSDRARLMMALDHLIECVTRPELFRAELDSARLLLRELEEGK